MSTIFTDAAGNKYLGDCRWANHDINYPATNWLVGVDAITAYSSNFLADISAFLTNIGYTSVSVISANTWQQNPPNNTTIFTGSANSGAFSLITNLYSGRAPKPSIQTLITGNSVSQETSFSYPFQYATCANLNSLALMVWSPSADKTAHQGMPTFYYWGKLQNINTNNNYYSSSTINHSVAFQYFTNNSQLYTTAFPPYSSQASDFKHYIVNAQKILLQSGRATYTISCSDGQTPGSKWATDMWVYDNNPVLGDPVIGRVPNMLLGTGTYTYLKPEKIQGNVFPDGGSPWYLPVGTFSGKVLLMRCYSSVS